MTSRSDPARPADIILDLSRLLSRVHHFTPTGIDRVEMAYARGLLAIAADRLQFAAVHPIGLYGRLDKARVLAFLDQTERRWEYDGMRTSCSHRRFAARTLFSLRPMRRQASTDARRVYVQASPHHLTNTALVQSILQKENARYVCLLHDLIPLQYPEYARPDGAAKHRKRLNTLLQYADGILCNSHATRHAFLSHLPPDPRDILVSVSHLGTQELADGATIPRTGSGRPYFVYVATIEPRKNHLLLLNLWRRMAEQRGADRIPDLVLIGRRGWENEQIVDMLDRCPALTGYIKEHRALSDRETRRLMAGSNGLLMPSFAEGYGMPVTEALDLGVPVICSDLESLHEAGGDVPEYLDPLDGPSWQQAIDAFAGGDPQRIAAQRARLARWVRPTWEAHIALLNKMIEAVA